MLSSPAAPQVFLRAVLAHVPAEQSKHRHPQANCAFHSIDGVGPCKRIRKDRATPAQSLMFKVRSWWSWGRTWWHFAMSGPVYLGSVCEEGKDKEADCSGSGTGDIGQTAVWWCWSQSEDSWAVALVALGGLGWGRVRFIVRRVGQTWRTRGIEAKVVDDHWTFLTLYMFLYTNMYRYIYILHDINISIIHNNTYWYIAL